jgi:hypothetical protein
MKFFRVSGDEQSRLNELDYLEDMNQVDFGVCTLKGKESSIKNLVVIKK